MTDISYDGDTLSLETRDIRFSRDIRSLVELPEKVIVLLTPLEDDCQNIVAYSKHGDKVWEIEPVYTHSGDECSPYTGVVRKENQVIAANWNSKDYIVNVESGEVTRLRTTK